MNPMTPDNMQQNPPIQIDSSTAIRIAMGAQMNYERSLMARIDMWHNIRIIRGSHFDKETILKAIMRTIEPTDLIPVKYHVCGEDAYFIVRNCGPALEKLFKTNLIINNVAGDAIILVITLGYASIYNLEVHIQPLLQTVLNKRYDPNRKMLDLKSFHTDPEIDKVVYCPLSQLRMSNHVLKLTKTAVKHYEHLSLQRNELSNLSAIENSNLTSVKYLDLRHNSLLNMNALTPLKNLTIMKIWLDGNPLCENYSSANQYLESVKKYCPHVQEVDGVCIVPNMPLIYKDYFPNDTTQCLVRRFAAHFFTLFDQLDKTVLRGLYHKNAFYSLSLAVPNALAQKMNLSQYLRRNLLKTGPKKLMYLYHGQEEILANLNKLPKSYHDRSSLNYDVMYDNRECLVVCISGLFKKFSSSTDVLSFSRTFVLSAACDNEYHIMNDQCHIDVAPKDLTPDRIISTTYAHNIVHEIVPTCFSPNEKSVLIVRLKQITTLTDAWCENYLSDAQWDMRKAINNFMKDSNSSSVPEHAFVRQNTRAQRGVTASRPAFPY